MKHQISFLFWRVAALLLIPYFAVIGFQGKEIALMNRIPKAEDCLPFILSEEIEADSEEETLKAQAVIARTNLYRRIKEGESLYDILNECENSRKAAEKIYLDAVKATENIVLSWKGELKQIPYHEVSSGKTRSGEEVFRDQDFAYLKSVDSSADMDSPNYLSSVYIEEGQLPKEFEVEERDSAGYVQSIEADGNILEGEGFRRGMGLSSADFTVQKLNGKVRFLCRGKGHGLGFSQYGGNELAKEGKNYKEILTAYFPEMNQENIHKLF
ncbi:MAG: SpoIID/LytB domain-containing protein [Eubacteriales bacterium]|nr:SpoIID/LytB domain-containing protein [Eubacteriales bacterium]